MKKGSLFMISGPAGVGKNTVINTLLSHNPNYNAIPSYTTRPPREEDVLSGARLCVSNDDFQKMIAANELIEYEHVHQWFYGRRKIDIEKSLNDFEVTIVEIDVKGLPTYKKIYPHAKAIFISYENLELLRHRITQNRPDSTTAEIELRYQTALKEMEHQKQYDHAIINYEGHPEKAVAAIQDIINSTLAN